VSIGPEVPGTVLDLRFTPDGTLWLMTDQAVARLAGDTWSPYVSSYEGALVGMDDFQRVWVAAADGASIQAWNGVEWQTYGSAQGWKAPPGLTVRYGATSDQAGRVWVATTMDIRSFDGDRWTVYDRVALGLGPAESQGSSTRFLLHAAGDGTLWASACEELPPGPTEAGGVRWFDGSTWLGVGTPVERGCGGALASSADGSVWVGLDAVLLAFDPATGEWATHQPPAPPEGETFGQVAHLTFDALGQPWSLFTVCGGASCGTGWTLYRLADDEAWTRVDDTSEPEAVYFDVTGAAWLLSPAGVKRAADGLVQSAGDMEAQASAIDATGQIYVVGEQARELALWLVRPATE
jgi:hypothetical protein